MQSRSASALLACALLSFFTVVGCTTDNGFGLDGAEPATSAATAEGLSDGQIAGVVQAINQGEMTHARIALERAETPAVRQYAEHMITEHGRAMEELQALERSAGFTIEASPLREELTSQALALEQNLAAQEGAQFDRAYLDAQVMLHEQAVRTADERLMPEADSEAMRAFLQRIRPDLVQHLEMARRASEGQPMASR